MLHGTDDLNSPPKEGVLRIFIALKNPSPRPGLNPRTSGSIASTPLHHRGVMRDSECVEHCLLSNMYLVNKTFRIWFY
jgi:hypothetical protein